MLRYSMVALFVLANSFFVGVSRVSAQAPEITVNARSLDEFQFVIRALGEKAELFGLSGPDTFLTNYGRFINTAQPFTCAMTISTAMPKFVTEISLTNTQAFFASLADEGFTLSSTGELSKADSGLRFFVEQTGNRLRVADSADYLQKTRLPAFTPASGGADSAVTINVDWRNLSLPARSAVCRRGVSILLPTSTNSSLTFDGLPTLVNDLASERIVAIMNRADSFVLRFAIDQEKRVSLTTDVLNRSLGSGRTVESPFAQVSSEDTLISCQWNLPIESELRTLVGTWANLFAGNLKTFFGDQELQDSQGWSTLQEGAKVIAQHCKETVTLERLQGSLLVRENRDQTVFAIGLRVANAARLDSDLRRLIQSAIDSGAPISQPEFNIKSNSDLSLHRLRLNLGQNASAVEPTTSDIVVTLGTSTHALMIGVGPANEVLIEELVAPTTKPSSDWLTFHSASSPASKRTEDAKQTTRDWTTPTLAIQPTAQGFRITSTLPAVDAKRPAQYIGTRSPQVQP